MIPQDIERMLNIATSMDASTEQRNVVKVELRRRGYGEILSARVRKHNEEMRKQIEEMTDPFTAKRIDSIITDMAEKATK